MPLYSPIPFIFFAHVRKKQYLCSLILVSVYPRYSILQPIASEFAAYEHYFEGLFRDENPLLDKVLEYVRNKRGKQLRPQLVLLSAQMCHGVTEKTMISAAAMEMLHTASLIHDDVVDASAKRRGHDAVHVRWNNKVAVLVGDYLLSRVIGLISEARNTQILNIVAGIGTTLSSGELLQIHANQSLWITEEQYYQVISKKTASLFAACMEAGAASSAASMRQTTALKDFGWHLGMCFQLKDDVFDFSDSEDLGKPTMSDIFDGKLTLPLFVALQRAPKQESDALRAQVETFLQDATMMDRVELEQEIKSFVLRYDGIRYAYRKMQEHKEKAMEVLNIFHDSSAKQSLMALLDYAINRVH